MNEVTIVTQNTFPWDKLIDILNITVPFITAFGIAWVNAIYSNSIKKKEILRERINNLYFPFYKMYIENYLYSNEYTLSFMDIEIIDKFMYLLLNNVYLMGTKSQKLIPVLYKEYLDLSHYRYQNPEKLENKYAMTFDSVFSSISQELFAEYKCICSKLKLPQPAI